MYPQTGIENWLKPPDRQSIIEPLLAMLFRVVLTSKSLDKTLLYNIRMKGSNQCIHAALFISLYKVVLTFVYEDDNLACDLSNKNN